MTFSAAVDITGTPQLELDFDGTPKPANCTAATNTTTMVCTYTVAVNDSAPNGIAIAANKLTLNGGTITATGSTTLDADLDHAAVAIDANHKVDGIRPTLVTTGSEAPTTSTDGTQVILTFSETIGVVDRTKITIRSTIGSTTHNVSTTAANADGTKVELDLMGTITSSIPTFTVALAADAVEDTATNGNLAVAATAVVNALVAVPGAVNPIATAGDGQVRLDWLTPADNGSVILRYQVQQHTLTTGSFVSGPWANIPESNANTVSHTVTGLTNGDTYAFGVRAVNSIGPGPHNISLAVIPGTIPDAPSTLRAEAGDGQARLAWTAPASDGGNAITGYDYRQRVGNGSFGAWMPILNSDANTTEHTVTGLTNGTSYTFEVRAVNPMDGHPHGQRGAVHAVRRGRRGVAAGRLHAAGDGLLRT